MYSPRRIQLTALLIGFLLALFYITDALVLSSIMSNIIIRSVVFISMPLLSLALCFPQIYKHIYAVEILVMIAGVINVVGSGIIFTVSSSQLMPLGVVLSNSAVILMMPLRLHIAIIIALMGFLSFFIPFISVYVHRFTLSSGGYILFVVSTIIVDVLLACFRDYCSRKAFEKKMDLYRQWSMAQEERNRSNIILRNAFPDFYVERLQKGELLPLLTKHKHATVFVSDIVSFTNFSSKLSAQYLVDILHLYFVLCDDLAAELGLEKVKTIGDAYFCVSGINNKDNQYSYSSSESNSPELPSRSTDDIRKDTLSSSSSSLNTSDTSLHDEDEQNQATINTVIFALKMLKLLESNSHSGEPFSEIKIRIGICTGPVTSAALGCAGRKISFDCFGSAVDLGNQLEAQGRISCIHTTEHVKDIVENNMEYISQNTSVDIGITQVQHIERSPSTSSCSILFNNENDIDLRTYKTYVIYIKDCSRTYSSIYNNFEPPPLLLRSKEPIVSPVIRNTVTECENSNRNVTPIGEEEEQGIRGLNELVDTDTEDSGDHIENENPSQERSVVFRQDENNIWQVDLQALTIQASHNLISPNSVTFRPSFSLVSSLETAVPPNSSLTFGNTTFQNFFPILSIIKETKYFRHLLRSSITVKYTQVLLLIQLMLMIAIIGIEIMLDKSVLHLKDHHLLLFQFPILGSMLITCVFSFIFITVIGRYLRKMNNKEKGLDEQISQEEQNITRETSHGTRGNLEHYVCQKIDQVMSTAEFRDSQVQDHEQHYNGRNNEEEDNGEKGESSVESKYNPTLYSSNENEYYDHSSIGSSIHPEIRQRHSPIQQEDHLKGSPNLKTPLLSENQHRDYSTQQSDPLIQLKKHHKTTILLRSVITLLICILAQFIMCLFSVTIFIHEDGFFLLNLFVTVMVLNVWTPVPIYITMTLTISVVGIMFLGFSLFQHGDESSEWANIEWSTAIVSTVCAFIFFSFANHFLDLHNKNAFLFSQKRRQQIKQMKKEEVDNQALLGSILPRVIIKRLQLHPHLNFDKIIEGSVLFAYLSPKSKDHHHMPIKEEINILSCILSKFDTMCDKYNVLNIKSIGKTFIAVSGCPHYQSRHAQNIALLALEMIGKIQKYWPQFSIKIGLYSGPFIGGAIGKDKITYDCFGDTINMGSRMASTSEPFHCQISGRICTLLQSEFILQDRGEINIKGKGYIKTQCLVSSKHRKHHKRNLEEI